MHYYVIPVLLIFLSWTTLIAEATFSRLVTPCDTPFGAGRCVADRKCCQDFGGIIFTSDGVQTPKKELIQYRVAGINAPKSFVPGAEDDDLDDDNTPGHIFPRANLIGCENTDVCCYLQPLSSTERESSSCSICGVRGDGDNQPPNLNEIRDQDNELPSRTLDVTSPPATRPTTTETPTTIKPGPPRKVIPRIFDYSYAFDYSQMARIINGRNANKNANCWQVALSNASGVFGSGVLLDFQTVLTVAHKVVGLKRTEFITILGAYDFAADDLMTQTYYTYPTEIIVHPEYNPRNYDNDIAILKIPPVSCDKPNICTICLPDGPADANACAIHAMPKSLLADIDTSRPLKPNETLILHRDDFLDTNDVTMLQSKSRGGVGAVARNGPVGSVCDRRCVVSGWGTTRDQEIATVLQETRMSVINNRDCEARLKATGVRNFTVVKSMFCARSHHDESGTCDRDGGGPLVCQSDDGKWVLQGLTALGLDNCQFGDQAPGMFVDVGKYVDWIVKVGFVKQSNSLGSRNTANVQVKTSAKGQTLELRSNLNGPAAVPVSNGNNTSLKTDARPPLTPHLKLFANQAPPKVPFMPNVPLHPAQLKRTNPDLHPMPDTKLLPIEI